MNIKIREERLALSQVAPLEPKSSASTDSAILALNILYHIIEKLQFKRPKKHIYALYWLKFRIITPDSYNAFILILLQ